MAADREGDSRSRGSAIATLRDTILHSAVGVLPRSGSRLTARSLGQIERLDPNDWRLVTENAVGVRYTPLTTRGHARIGTRERVLEVVQQHPDRLKVELDALVTSVLFDDRNRATGVEYLKGERLYRAHAPAGAGAGERIRRKRRAK